MFKLFKRKKKLGWVNVYIEGGSRLRYGNYPKKTKKQAIEVKCKSPRGEYLSTICLYSD